MIEFRAVAYSDIHYHHYDNGLTINDINNIEAEVLEAAREHQANIILHGGDWFQARNPLHSLRAMRDANLKKKAQEFQMALLLGNHDREGRSAHSGHALMHLPVFKESVPNVLIMDERKRYRLDPSNSDLKMVLDIHAVPAGHSIEIAPFEEAGADLNLCMFHDMIKGSWQQNGIEAKHGLDPAVLDLPWFDLVLGGDNHVAQELKLSNTKGYYIGAPCQHNWGDAKQDRGYVKITVIKDGGTKWVDVQHILTKTPKFIKIQATIDTPESAKNIVKTVAGWNADNRYIGNIVHITLMGDGALLSKIKAHVLEDQLAKEVKARKVQVTIEPTIVVREMVPELRTTRTPDEDWQVYIRSGKLDLDGVSQDQVISMGLEVLYNAR